jgi:hypothetical protein
VSGVLGVLVAAGSVTRHVVTVGLGGSFSLAGFSRPSQLNFGSIDENETNGVEIVSIYSRSSSDLQVWLSGEHSQNRFHSITLEDGTGALRTFNTADADDFQNQSDVFSVWFWGDGSDVVWETTDDTEQHEVSFRY